MWGIMDEAVIKRTQPNNAEAEQAVVGAMMNDNDVIATAMEMLLRRWGKLPLASGMCLR